MRKVLGYLLLSLPFAGIAVGVTYVHGIWAALALYGIALLVLGIIMVGVHLVLD